MNRSGIVLRSLAVIIDHLVLSSLFFVIGLSAYRFFGPQEITLNVLRLEWYRRAIVLGYIALTLIYFLYHFVQEIYGTGTVGKVLLGLKLKTVAGDKPERGVLVVRHLAKFIVVYCSLVVGLIFLLPLQNELANALMLRSSYQADLVWKTFLVSGEGAVAAWLFVKYGALIYLALNAVLLLLPAKLAFYDLVAGSAIYKYSDHERYQQKLESERQQYREAIEVKRATIARETGQEKKALDELIFK